MKVAIITGGNRGIGKSAALNVAKRGIGVILTYRSHAEEANAVVSEIKKAGGKAVALKLDVSQSASFSDFAGQVSEILQKEWGLKTFDYLVNNAGIAQRTPIQETTEPQFDELVDVHFKGPFFLTQKLAPLMNDGGHILNISSGLARFSHIGTAVYGAVKGAIEVLTRYQAQEYSAKKIRVNVIAPGALDTDFGGGRTDEVRKAISNLILLGRMGTADDIGPLIASLLSDEMGWINAQRIEASGGMYV